MIPVEPIMQEIIVEEPTERIVKSAKETIQVPVTKTRQEIVREEVNIETEEQKAMKIKLESERVKRVAETTRRQREVDSHIHELELAQAQAEKLKNALEIKRLEHTQSLKECEHV